MQLDKRFKVLPFCCLSAEKCDKYIGQKGYFSNNIALFKNIDLCIDGTLEAVHGDEAESFEMRDNRKFYRYFIPECFVEPKEKQFRPYTLQEFKGNLPKMIFPDDLIHFRHKNNEFSEYAQRYNGYIVNSRATVICLGSREYTLGDLFENFEYLDKDGEWNTFGVEE